jgi:pyrrolidone-carboxylate peptidase
MYSTLHVLAAAGGSRRAGFVHLPSLPSMVVPGDGLQPSMDLALMLRGVEAALEVVAAPS